MVELMECNDRSWRPQILLAPAPTLTLELEGRALRRMDIFLEAFMVTLVEPLMEVYGLAIAPEPMYYVLSNLLLNFK